MQMKIESNLSETEQLNINKNQTEKKENTPITPIPFMPLSQIPESASLTDSPINIYTDLQNIKVAYVLRKSQ